MSNFRKAIEYVIRVDEGGWCNTRNDSGGETYEGIARNYNPMWPGWALIDAHKPFPVGASNSKITAILRADPSLEPMVMAFYNRQYWRFDGITDDRVATKVLDLSVNMQHDGNCGPAIKILQNSVNDQFPNFVEVDGFWGLKTQNAVNQCNPDELLNSMAEYAKARYKMLIEKNPNLADFKNSWIARAERIPQAEELV